MKSPESAHWYSSGQSVLWGPSLELYKNLDRIFLSFAEHRKAKEYLFPSFVAAKELNKLDYFKSFPHLVSFPVALDSSDENIEAFTSGERINAKGEMQFTKLKPVEEVLTPAACYHFYILFQGQTFDEPRYLTTRCTCYRRESHYVQLRRQWNFSMREIVCIGTSEQVQTFVDFYRGVIDEFTKKLGLPLRWEGATDPFFNPSQNPKFLMQKLDPVKNELTYGDGLAIASTNFHRNYFGEAFGLKANGAEAYSGCVAFGLERWIAAITDHFGVDSNKWPKPESFL